ncbi:cold shock domain-containing protein [Streptomyces sp. 11-1-2]|uniref:cold shock domain-containing protein n=1 Tax=Streptomyces sp. 11-1-2 TaxID=1851167 RepID=UPI0013C48481|nr:cold shock domain-containing protein [Streptomyces sp. 11-1-2]
MTPRGRRRQTRRTPADAEHAKLGGRGVLDSLETPGGCFGHFSDIQVTGVRTLSPGQRVDLEWEAPGFQQDG